MGGDRPKIQRIVHGMYLNGLMISLLSGVIAGIFNL
jgi:hypothetical protein